MDSKINIASFEEGFELQRAVVAALAKQDIKIENFADSDKAPELLKSVITAMSLHILGDKDVLKALWVCLGRCLYNGQKITIDIFEKEENRKDFVPVAISCIEVNIEPFINGLFSAWKSINPTPILEGNPK